MIPLYKDMPEPKHIITLTWHDIYQKDTTLTKQQIIRIFNRVISSQHTTLFDSFRKDIQYNIHEYLEEFKRDKIRYRDMQAAWKRMQFDEELDDIAELENEISILEKKYSIEELG